MKSITIHSIDKEIDEKITEIARKKGLSLNKTIKHILRKALNIDGENSIDKSNEFKEFHGVWNKSEKKDFNSSIKDFGNIDKSDWK